MQSRKGQVMLIMLLDIQKRMASRARELIILCALICGASVAFFGSAHAQVDMGSARHDPERLPEAAIAYGTNSIEEAWLIKPTQRYRHFVLGRDYEAAGFRVRLKNQRVLTYELSADLVFEDRGPRLADLNGDGEDEIILVMSSRTQGAALAVFAIAGQDIEQNFEQYIELLAQTPPIGQANRWLNPNAIADFTGDGQMDIGLVQMPHLVKRLEIWTLRNGALRRELAVDDVSTHRIGSAFTQMHATQDVNGDGVIDLCVPNGSRDAIHCFSFNGAQAQRIFDVQLPARADGNFDREGDSLLVPLETGMVVKIDLK